jgi:hypothetical protein
VSSKTPDPAAMSNIPSDSRLTANHMATQPPGILIADSKRRVLVRASGLAQRAGLEAAPADAESTADSTAKAAQTTAQAAEAATKSGQAARGRGQAIIAAILYAGNLG